MVTYSTNYMGPISMDWFRERGLTHFITETVESEMISKIKDLPIGATYAIETVHTHYAAGRIDIRDSSKHGYDGWGEYGVAPMHGEDWNALGDFLWDFESEEVVPYDELIEMFEKDYGKKIRWWVDES